QGSFLRAERNRHYWNDAATRLDGVKYLQIADENAELRAYRANELHCTYVVPRGQFDWIKENLAAELHVVPQLSTYYFGFNLDRKRFTPKIRQA
ncbi:ABC transporter substrate-binding protein, partial [Klebsiella pneumoniae]|uniref:ABC transporter substrate-binding protein n=1 Tax=Klebsiella pneumoniae TaxID=573 RepID=UPI00226FEADA